MAETSHQYIERILKHSEGLVGLAVLAETPARLEALVVGTPREKWDVRAAPHRWSAGEVLAHLADCEIVAGWRVRSILGRDGTPLQPFDQDVWAAAFKYSEVDPAESLATFAATRASLLSLLRRVDPERRQHYGMHAERGKETIAHLIQLYAGHDLNHLKQIEALVT